MSYPLIKLGDYVEILSGFAFKSELFSDKENGLPLVRIRDVIDGTSKTYYSGSYSDEYIINDGDILIGMDGDFNREKWRGGKALLNQRVCKITADGIKLNQDYLYHLLPKKLENIHAVTSAVTVKHLSVKGIKDIEIPLPSLDEQKRIAAILDKADSIRRKRQQAIQLADQFLRAVFLDMFGDPITNPKGWEVVKLGNLCEVGSSKRVFVEEFTESGIPFYRGTEIGRLAENENIQSDIYISNKHYENLKKHSGVPEIGDLLLPSICHDGRIWKVNNNAPFYFKDGRVLWIKVNQSLINSDYLKNYLRNLFLTNYQSIASGTTFAELKIVILKELSVLSPPLNLQIKFAEITEKVIKEYQLNKNFLEKTDELFNSLSQKAFAGDIK